jgi:solute carrier family 25 S-adenosylmethionine transporter 26
MMQIDNSLLLNCALSRGLTIGILYPIDTVKSRLQNVHYFQQNIYKGFTYAVSTQMIYGMLVFGTYENMKLNSNNDIYSNIKNALISDLIGSIFLCPCEVIKQNIQVGTYQSVSQAFQSISLYKGYTSLLVRDLPFRIIQLPLYDELKKQNINTIFAGSIAGAAAGALTNPLDVIKTQMMCNPNYKNVLYDVKLYSKGLLQRITYLGCSSALFFTLFETFKSMH